MSNETAPVGRRPHAADDVLPHAAPGPERRFLSRGDVLELRAVDYKWGTADPLLLWIGRVIRIHELDDGLWIQVSGVELGSDGSPTRPRLSVVVRASGIARSKRAAATGTTAASASDRWPGC